MAVFLWVYGLMSPLSGIIGDRMSRKWLIVGSLCVWSGVTYLMGYATTFNQLYWLRGIMGISEALYFACCFVIDCRFSQRQDSLVGCGNTYDRVVCGTGYRWIWGYFCSNLFLAYNIPLVWYYRYTTTSAMDGTWKIQVQTPSAGGPYTITISDGKPVTLTNVLIGEVWLCSGQSNMEMPVKGFRGQPVEGSCDAIATALPSDNIRIRLRLK